MCHRVAQYKNFNIFFIACGLAPVMSIGGKTYGRMTPEKVKEVLAEYKN